MALHNVFFGQYDGLVSELVRLEGKHTAQRAHCALTQNLLLRTEDLRKDGFHQSPKLVFLNIFGGALAFHNFQLTHRRWHNIFMTVVIKIGSV